MTAAPQCFVCLLGWVSQTDVPCASSFTKYCCLHTSSLLHILYSYHLLLQCDKIILPQIMHIMVPPRGPCYSSEPLCASCCTNTEQRDNQMGENTRKKGEDAGITVTLSNFGDHGHDLLLQLSHCTLWYL